MIHAGARAAAGFCTHVTEDFKADSQRCSTQEVLRRFSAPEERIVDRNERNLANEALIGAAQNMSFLRSLRFGVFAINVPP